MKKKILALVLALGCILALTGCFCQHEWLDASCVDPQTCSKCEKTEGTALGHVWIAATCTEAKTCEVCGTTEGDPKGHDMVEASCEEPKHCTQCNLTEGDALGHTWLDATTDAPKTCQTCALTEGERIITDSRFQTSAVADLLGKWACDLELDGAMMELEGFQGTVAITYLMDFGNAGDVSITAQLADEDAFLDAIIDVSLEQSYAEYEAQGISRAEVDAAIEEAYGMTLEEYVREAMSSFDMNELMSSLFSAMNIGGVYYAKDGQLYIGDSWDSEMDPSAYTLKNDRLTIDDLSEGLGIELIFYRVTE